MAPTRVFPHVTTGQRAAPPRGFPGPAVAEHYAAGQRVGWWRFERAGRGEIGVDQPPRVAKAQAFEEAVIIASITPESWAYAERFAAEDETVVRARRRGREVGAVPVGPGAGAALQVLAAAIGARTVVEIGTGAGVSGLYLLAGMRPDGVLTSVDIESEHQRLAREAFAEAGVAHNRTRLITGAALEVLPRLTDGAYDLVFCDADKAEYADYLHQALRLLRPGGVVAFDNALWHDRVADPAQRDPDTVAIRGLGRAVADDEHLVSALLPVGDGLLVAVKRNPSPEGED